MPCITEPCHLVTHHSASAAERIAFLNSARSARAIHPIGSEQRLANRIAFSHVLSSAHRLQVYIGRQRLNVPAIKHVQSLVTKARQNERGNQSGDKQQCARVPGRIGVDPSAQGGVHRIRVMSPIRVVWRGVLFGARFSWNWICGCLHARQPWQRSDHAAGTRLFRGSDKAANLMPIALNILWESRTRSGSGA